jgi:peroxiredoxin
MRLKPILFLLLVGSISGYFVYREVTRVGQPGVINIGEKAPDLLLKAEDGSTLKLSDYRGQVIFLNFWATWCEPCVEEMPEMEIMKERFKDRKFKMLAVSVDINWETVKDFYKKYNLSIPAYLDPGHQATTTFKVYKFPETFIINADGYVVKHTWSANWATPQALASMDALIREAEGSPKISEVQ